MLAVANRSLSIEMCHQLLVVKVFDNHQKVEMSHLAWFQQKQQFFPQRYWNLKKHCIFKKIEQFTTIIKGDNA